MVCIDLIKFMKKTKIVATIGPASWTLEGMKEIADTGANIARFNFSHADHGKTKEQFDIIKNNNIPLAIMLDTKGPEIRTGEVKTALEVKTGDKITLTTEQGVYEDTGKISVNYKEFLSDAKIGSILSVDSGAFFIQVKEIKNNDIIVEVIKGSGKITTKRHINFASGEDTTQPTLGEKDWKDIDFGIQEEVDFVALSFCRTSKDITDLREYCTKRGHVPAIIAKIENQKGVDNIEEIIQASDGVMVARGDLSEEIPYYKVPQIQKDIVELCQFYSKPVIIATQMVLSMCENIRPTRAEINDVATAVFQGADATMTSDETGKGKYPTESIRIMSEIVSNNEPQALSIDEKIDDKSINTEITKAAVAGINTIIGIDAVVVITKSGEIANDVSQADLSVPIFAFTNNTLATNKLRLRYGVLPHTIDFDKDYEKTIQIAFSEVKKTENIKKVLLISYYLVGDKEYPLITIRDL
jgi:pyruvate kinase